MTRSAGGVGVRLARAEDVDALTEFNLAMARETEGKALAREIVAAGVRGLLANPRHGFYTVAELDGRAVGALMVTREWSDWRDGEFWWIQSVYVRPEHRRRGVYRRLYEFVKASAAEQGGVCGFRLYVEQDNRVAQAAYRALGMRETAYRVFEEILG